MVKDWVTGLLQCFEVLWIHFVDSIVENQDIFDLVDHRTGEDLVKLTDRPTLKSHLLYR